MVPTLSSPGPNTPNLLLSLQFTAITAATPFHGLPAPSKLFMPHRLITHPPVETPRFCRFLMSTYAHSNPPSRVVTEFRNPPLPPSHRKSVIIRSYQHHGSFGDWQCD